MLGVIPGWHVAPTAGYERADDCLNVGVLCG
jgi:hypothetical protein